MYQLSAYPTVLALLGAAILIAYWLPRFFSGREPAASALLILLGLASNLIVPDLTQSFSPLGMPVLWEHTSEMALIVALFGTGLRIDRLVGWRGFAASIRLLVFAMPLTILGVGLIGWYAAGLSIPLALLIGATLAPTDPVLAGDVQVGPPQEGGEHPVRFTLTAEAGLNDGLAFPFVILALVLAAENFSISNLWPWLLQDLLYGIGAGILLGIAIGWMLGRICFYVPSSNPLADTASGVVAFAGVLFCYGITQLLGGYGFIACFVAGVTMRRAEADHGFHQRLHNFSESIEHALTAAMLVGLGAMLPPLLVSLDWGHAMIGIGLIFVVRPAAAWLSLIGSRIRGGLD